MVINGDLVRVTPYAGRQLGRQSGIEAPLQLRQVFDAELLIKIERVA
jgi:hypothetical protein